MDGVPKFGCVVDLDARTNGAQTQRSWLALGYVQVVHAQVILDYLRSLLYSYSAHRSAAQQGECCLRHGVSLCQDSCSALTQNL